MTETIDPALAANGSRADDDRQQRSLTTAAARNLATSAAVLVPDALGVLENVELGD